jgi:hypothetical protein
MAVRESLVALRNEFVAIAAQSALARYSREATYLNDSQLGVQCDQLAVCHRRLQRELNEEIAKMDSRVPAHQLQLVRDTEIQKEAFEQERFVRSYSAKMANAFT